MYDTVSERYNLVPKTVISDADYNDGSGISYNNLETNRTYNDRLTNLQKNSGLFGKIQNEKSDNIMNLKYVPRTKLNDDKFYEQDYKDFAPKTGMTVEKETFLGFDLNEKISRNFVILFYVIIMVFITLLYMQQKTIKKLNKLAFGSISNPLTSH